MYLPIEASYNSLRTIDVNKLKFRYSWMDIQTTAKTKVGREKKIFKNRRRINVYPDTGLD
jgi:hypothetical protein